MSNDLTPFLDEAFEGFDRWRDGIERCPLFKTPVNYIQAQSMNLNILRTPDGGGGEADFGLERLTATYSNASEFCRCFSHEAKHFRQADEHQVLFRNTEKFTLDLLMSLTMDRSYMADNYLLPLPVDAGAAEIVCEFDPHLLDLMVGVETNNAFSFNQIAISQGQTLPFAENISGPVTQKLIETAYQKMKVDWYSGNYPFVDFCRDKGIEWWLERDADMSALHRKYGRRPHIEWVSISDRDFQSITMPFWEENGFSFPIAVPDGIFEIQEYRRFVQRVFDWDDFTQKIETGGRETIKGLRHDKNDKTPLKHD